MKARKTGETARVGAGLFPALYPGAREGRSPLASCERGDQLVDESYPDKERKAADEGAVIATRA